MKYILSTILVFLSLTSFSQSRPDTTHFFFDYTSTGSLNKTQSSSSFLLNNGFNTLLKSKDYSITLNSSFLYGKINKVVTNRDFSSIVNFDEFKHAPFEHTFYWGLAEYNSTYSLHIHSQKEIGFGLSYILIHDKIQHLSISDGIVYDQSDLGLNDTHITHNVYMNSIRLRCHFEIKDKFQLDNISYLQNTINDTKDNIIKSKTTASIKVYKWLAIGTSLSYNKLTFVQRENFLLTYGLFISKSI